jgi:hypothetical protein
VRRYHLAPPQDLTKTALENARERFSPEGERKFNARVIECYILDAPGSFHRTVEEHSQWAVEQKGLIEQPDPFFVHPELYPANNVTSIHSITTENKP